MTCPLCNSDDTVLLSTTVDVQIIKQYACNSCKKTFVKKTEDLRYNKDGKLLKGVK